MDAPVTRSTSSALQIALARERIIVLTALVIVAAVSAMTMIHTGDALMRGGQGTFVYSLFVFLMWWTMMMAMMLPSAAPAILTFATINRKLRSEGSTGEFALGYAAVWTAFSLAATLLHLGFEKLVPFTGMMAVTSRTLGGVVLIASGVYQLTPLKAACLKKCQIPLFFLARNWQGGRAGALRMGVHHGLYCLGCCWVLMAVLFYGGVMELSWVLGIALYVLAEKLLPSRFRLRNISGVILVAWGIVILGLSAG